MPRSGNCPKKNSFRSEIFMAHPIATFPRTKTVRLGAHTFEVYSISWLALFIHRRPGTIKIWEERKLLPKPLLDLGRHRYYTANEIMEYACAFRTSDTKTGTALETTPFRAKCAEARMRLRRIVEKEPERILKELPNKTRLSLRSIELVRRSVVKRMGDEHDMQMVRLLRAARKSSIVIRKKPAH